MPSRLRCANYNECAELIYPENPEAGSSKMRCLCDGCYAYAYPKDIPQPREKPVSNNAINELKCKFVYLQNKINSHIDASKRKRKSLKEFD